MTGTYEDKQSRGLLTGAIALHLGLFWKDLCLGIKTRASCMSDKSFITELHISLGSQTKKSIYSFNTEIDTYTHNTHECAYSHVCTHTCTQSSRYQFYFIIDLKSFADHVPIYIVSLTGPGFLKEQRKVHSRGIS